MVFDSILCGLLIVLWLLFIVGGFVPPAGAPRLLIEMNQLGPWVAGFSALLLWRIWRNPASEGAWRRLQTLLIRMCATPRPLYVFTAMWALLLAMVSIRRHLAFEDNGDLAIFDQAFWNTLHGAFLRSSLVPGASAEVSIFADHFDPLQLVLLPFYLVFPSPIVLLAAQAVALSLGALPLYWLARRRFPGSPVLATTFPVLYLLYLPLRSANRYDYHPSTLAPPLLLLALYFLDRSRYTWMVVFLVLAGLLKENLPIAGVAIGSYLLLVERRRRLGLGLIIAFGLWFYAGFAWIIPAFNPRGYAHFLQYPALAGSAGGILLAPLRHPLDFLAALFAEPGRKLMFLLYVFAPVAFLPLLSPWRLCLGIPFLVQILLSAAPHQTSLNTHHAAESIPFVFFAAVGGAHTLLQWLEARGVPSTRRDTGGLDRALAGVMLACSLMFHGLPETFHLRFYARTAQHGRLDAALATIRADASVSTWSKILPHVAHRRALSRFPVLGFDGAPDAEFVIIDDTLLPRTDLLPVAAALATLPSKGYERILDQDGISVFRKRR